MVRIKLIPVATGTVNDKFPVERDLNITSADKKIIQNAMRTGNWKRNPVHSEKFASLRPFRFHLIRAAPLTFNTA